MATGEVLPTVRIDTIRPAPLPYPAAHAASHTDGGGETIDGIALTHGDRIMVPDILPRAHTQHAPGTLTVTDENDTIAVFPGNNDHYININTSNWTPYPLHNPDVREQRVRQPSNVASGPGPCPQCGADTARSTEGDPTGPYWQCTKSECNGRRHWNHDNRLTDVQQSQKRKRHYK